MCRPTPPCGPVAQAGGFEPRLPPWMSASVWQSAKAPACAALLRARALRRCGPLRCNRALFVAPVVHMAAAYIETVHIEAERTEAADTEAEYTEAAHIEAK